SMYHHFSGLAWMPWVLLALERLLADRGIASAVVLGAAAAAQLLAGSADMCLMTAVAAVLRVMATLLTPAGRLALPRLPGRCGPRRAPGAPGPGRRGFAPRRRLRGGAVASARGARRVGRPHRTGIGRKHVLVAAPALPPRRGRAPAHGRPADDPGAPRSPVRVEGAAPRLPLRRRADRVPGRPRPRRRRPARPLRRCSQRPLTRPCPLRPHAAPPRALPRAVYRLMALSYEVRDARVALRLPPGRRGRGRVSRGLVAARAPPRPDREHSCRARSGRLPRSRPLGRQGARTPGALGRG